MTNNVVVRHIGAMVVLPARHLIGHPAAMTALQRRSQ
jgi:hypothetical protein